MASSAFTVQDGAAAAVNATGTIKLTPGNTITLALTTTTGITSWRIRCTASDVASALNLASYQTATFSYTFTAPSVPCTLTFLSQADDGSASVASAAASFALGLEGGASGSVAPVTESFQVRGVCTTAETLASFDSVSGGTPRDGVTYAQGDIVLLVNQAAKAANGPYVVGLVAAGAAPLTRPAWFATGATVKGGLVFEVSEGTLFAQTSWKITTAGAITVDTTTFDCYPRSVTQAITLVAGTTAALTTVPILSATKSGFCYARTTANTTTLTIIYAPNGAVTAGIAGTGSVTWMACVAAGTINVADISVGNLTIVNW